MVTISIRELHMNTGRWIRRAAGGEPVVVTERGRHVAELRALDAAPRGRPLPNREARIRKRTRISADSASYVSDMRTRG